MLAQIDEAGRRLGAVAFFLVGLVLLLWAFLMPAVQCLHWLKTGIWQPVPFLTIFLSPEAQVFNLLMTPPGISPLDLAPSLAAFESLDALVFELSGTMLGVAKLLAWALDVALAVWLLAAGCASMAASAALDEATSLTTPAAATISSATSRQP